MTTKIFYETQARATGGRDGCATTLDGRFDAKLTTPKELGGPAAKGPIPNSCSPPVTAPASSTP